MNAKPLSIWFKTNGELGLHLLFWVLCFVFPLAKAAAEPKYYQFDYKVTLYRIFIIVVPAYLYYLAVFPRLFKAGRYVTLVCSALMISAGFAWIDCLISRHFISDCECSIWLCLLNNLVGNASLLFFFTAIYLFKQYHSKQQELEQTEKEKLGAELNYLKSQINPHYLFNTLNTIYSYSLDNSRHVPEMLLKLSNNLRYVLYDSESPQVSLAKEIQHLENYIALQQLRLEGRVVVNFSVVGPVEKYTIAPLLLIAFVENAFKHGSEPIQTTSEIIVRITIQEGVLDFACENQYLETPATASEYKHTEGGIGLHNVTKRLELMYGQAFTLNTSREDGHFLAHLKVNL